MTKTILIILGLLILFVIIWRVSTRYYCPSWLGWIVELDNPLSKINRAATIVKNADIQPGMKVLDAGCGPGRLTIPVAKKVGPKGNVVALDIQAEMLSKVQTKARAANIENITFIHAGAGEQKLERNTFDRVLLVTVLGEIKNQKAALKEMFDVLKPGGILSITETIFDPHYQRQHKVLQLVSEVGFKEKEVFTDWFSFTLNVQKPVKD